MTSRFGFLKGGKQDEGNGCGFLASREIDAFIDNRLSGRRHDAFQTHQLSGCHACALLAADLEAFSGVLVGGPLASEVRDFESTRSILEAQFRQTLESLKPARAFSFSFNWAAMGAAAAMLLLAVVAFQVMGPGGDPGVPGGVVVLDAPSAIRDGGEATWNKAISAYENESYDRAARLFAQSSAADAPLYRGVSLVMAGQNATAIEILRDVRNTAIAEGAGTTISSYYLAVALVAEGQVEQARELLTTVSATGGEFGTSADDLLEEIN